jgi:ATP-binding cassette subfamily B multidrug efflux pump
MIAAAKRAEAHEFTSGLIDARGRTGYDALVRERGVRLSGGRRQREVLARVILKDAPILILDEAKSALDSEVEVAIRDTLYGVMEGKTVIAITHQLSTNAQMDRIVVLDNGRVTEHRPHAELLSKNGLYARFWARQSGVLIGLDA